MGVIGKEGIRLSGPGSNSPVPSSDSTTASQMPPPQRSSLDALDEMLDYYPIVEQDLEQVIEQARSEVAEREEHRSLWRRLLANPADDRAACLPDSRHSVAAQLTSLGPQWHWLHTVRSGERGTHVDEVVISPAGVFTINAVTEADTRIVVKGNRYIVDGEETSRIRHNREAAGRTSELLGAAAGFAVPVCALICVTGAERGFKVIHQPEHRDVVVLPLGRLGEFLATQSEVFSVDEVDRVFAVARKLTTWNEPI